MEITPEKYPYRQAVLGIVIDKNKHFLLVQKLDYEDNEWSFAGGGVEEGETPRRALLRELKEELGSDKFKVMAESALPYSYEWSDETIMKRFTKKGELFRGQQVKHFLVDFFGERNELQIQASELRSLKWVPYSELVDNLIFPGQWQSAERVIKELL